MTKINDLTIEELINVAESGELSPDQEKKVKDYTLTRLKERLADGNTLSEEEKSLIVGKISVYNADVYGVQDMGYPYVKAKPSERQTPLTGQTSHVDMYCASEPLHSEN